MQSANLEFRKIPSLKFFCEVNCDGSIVRNARSKRHLQCRKENIDGENFWIVSVKIGKLFRKIFIHDIVAECFLGERPDNCTVEHIDGDTLNNLWTNLRYKIGGTFPSVKVHSVPVRLKNSEVTLDFATTRSAAKYLAEIYEGRNEKLFAGKFYKRRKKIFDYDIIYLNAETGHGNHDTGKEQSESILSEQQTDGMTRKNPKNTIALNTTSLSKI